MENNVVKKILNRLEIKDTGTYDNQFYVVHFESSDEYSRIYTKLNKNAINTEFPAFGTNTNNSTVKITNYFEIAENNTTYNLFLIADFNENDYYLKIGGL
jgi:hypothetical protein